MHQDSDGGGKGSRTPDLLIANETLYQLSYTPIIGLARISAGWLFAIHWPLCPPIFSTTRIFGRAHALDRLSKRGPIMRPLLAAILLLAAVPFAQAHGPGAGNDFGGRRVIIFGIDGC